MRERECGWDHVSKKIISCAGPFLLTELLLPLVEKAEEGRIVNVSSMLHEKVR